MTNAKGWACDVLHNRQLYKFPSYLVLAFCKNVLFTVNLTLMWFLKGYLLRSLAPKKDVCVHIKVFLDSLTSSKGYDFQILSSRCCWPTTLFELDMLFFKYFRNKLLCMQIYFIIISACLCYSGDVFLSPIMIWDVFKNWVLFYVKLVRKTAIMSKQYVT